MKWRGRRRSTNIEDRRGARTARRMPGRIRFPTGRRRQGGIRLPRGTGGRRTIARGGVGGLGLIAIVLIALFFGIDPSVLLQGPTVGPSGQVATEAPPPSRQDQALRDFVAVVLADTEDVWHGLLQADGGYEEPRLVLFTSAVQSACGFAQAAVGPFYCPADQKIYIDLSFYEILRRRFDAPGDFAQAYVIAHEVGHHVQNLLGILPQVNDMRRRVSKSEANALSVRLELQADCLAGVWAHHAEQAWQILEPGDIEEALGAASAIGDDNIQRQSGSVVIPDSFTHGSSAQRVRWFRQGLDRGLVSSCNTFEAARL